MSYDDFRRRRSCIIKEIFHIEFRNFTQKRAPTNRRFIVFYTYNIRIWFFFFSFLVFFSDYKKNNRKIIIIVDEFHNIHT